MEYGIDKFLASLEKDFGSAGKGKLFEKFCKWFLENDPAWSSRVDKVWLFSDYPEKWQAKDLGTDLVFRDVDGLIWAVQAKCYDEKYSTTKKDVDSFLADSGRKQVNKRLWVQTTNKMASNAKTALQGQDKPVTIFTLDDFRDSNLTYPKSFAELNKVKQKKKRTPDPHQKRAIKEVTEKFKEFDKGRLIMACGTGKTLTTLWIKEKLSAKKTLVLVPSLNLLSQTMREWASDANNKFQILNVCSDKSVGIPEEDLRTGDAAFPVTSDVSEISNFLKRKDCGVVFSTYQSSDLIQAAQRKKGVPSFDLVIADEAHRCTGKTTAPFTIILDEKKIRATKRLFTTATPKYYGKAVKAAAGAKDIEIVGMEDENVFGPEFHKLSFGEAIQKDLLNDYQVVVTGVTEADVKGWIDERELFELSPNENIDAGSLAAHIGLLKAVKKYDLQRIISFHNRVSRAEEFSENFDKTLSLLKRKKRPSGIFFSEFVSGKMKTSERRNKIKKLENLTGFDRGVLSNARCLSEGVNVPVLDGVAFIDPKRSQIDIVQAVGRAIRKVRHQVEQKKGTIVLPIFIEDGKQVEDVIEGDAFEPIWIVLKALRAHDELLGEMLDSYRTKLGKQKTTKIDFGTKITFDISTKIPTKFVDALSIKIVEATTESWGYWFGLLEKFVEENGHARVEAKYVTPDGQKLGVWCDTQRTQYKQGFLSADRLQSLEQLINQGWVWSLSGTQREENIRRLKDYFLKEGHSTPPDAHKEDDGFDLGARCKGLRQAYENNTLERKWIKYLEEELFFIWDPDRYDWIQQYRGLRKWCRENKRPAPPEKTKYPIQIGPKKFKDLDIETFRSRMLSSYSYWVLGNKGDRKVPPRQLTAQEINVLERIPYWSWNAREDVYKELIQQIDLFLKEHKVSDLKTSTVFDGYPLGNKLTKIKSRRDRVPSFVLQYLDEIGYDLDPFETKWNAKYELLVSYVKEFGTARVPQSIVYENEPIGGWVSTQRTAFNSGNLSDERRARLENLNGWTWDASDDAASSLSKKGFSPKKIKEGKG